MGLRLKGGKIMSINTNKCAKDIANSMRKGESTGNKINAVSRVKSRLTGLLRSDVLKED